MKTNILIIIIGLFGLAATKADTSYNAWDNYYYQYGQYFDNYFGCSRTHSDLQNWALHEKRLRELARMGIPYHNQYTGEYNGAETAQHIFNSSKDLEEYHRRMEVWKRGSQYHY